MRWLLYRRGGLGDTLLTFPLLELLKKKGKEVWAVGNTDYFRIAKEVGWCDKVLYEMPDEEFEGRLLISFDGNIKPFPEKRVWIVEHLLKESGLVGSFSKVLPLEPLEKSPLDRFAVLHPSSGSQKKNPRLELFLRVENFLQKKGYRTIYLVGEADAFLKGLVKHYWESHEPLEIARALKKAVLFVGLDSGLSHLSAYCGVPTFIFYGPTDPIVWRPIGEKVCQISLNLECSPCFPNVCEGRECLSETKLFEAFLRAFNSFF